MSVAPLGYTRRRILLVNEPQIVRRILGVEVDEYPKNDLFVGALEPLVGNGVFISTGDAWRRQRRMIEPAFSQLRLERAFVQMEAAATAMETMLDKQAAAGSTLSLDAAMSHVTADVVCRTIFSEPLAGSDARGIFDDFAQFQDSVANVRIGRLLLGRPGVNVPQPPRTRAACGRIRAWLRRRIAERMRPGAEICDDLAGAIIAARDPESGTPFDIDELVDQLGVFFLAGHETSATAVTWALYILSQQPALLGAVRDEVEAMREPFTPSLLRELPLTRNVLRETLRLYPPGPFLPRMATAPTTIAGHRLKRGAMVMISPWIMHRHREYWTDPEVFDAGRFDRDGGHSVGAYLPFGQGARACIGASFATVESLLLIARLVRRFDIEVLDPGSVRPVAKLTTRPVREIQVRLHPRATPAADTRCAGS